MLNKSTRIEKACKVKDKKRQKWTKVYNLTRPAKTKCTKC